ncbi:hypothetical protein [Halopiger goleimassiliensis]|uniref:hypothetical protein n=1 Tax=Halopiger goleimassiliensis TaxID=1293048 RepID=UPI000677A8BC|nr:hypothetical protein [Halopiger goleimassiliensis]
MTDTTSVDSRSPLAYVRHLLDASWRNLVNVYCLNTRFWQFLKSGALVWFGLMLWAFSNLVLSYKPEWTFVYVTMAYGFVLVVWGPLTHLVVVPLIIRLRRSGKAGESTLARTISRHGSKLNFATFLLIVIVLASIPFGPMVLDFQPGASGADSGTSEPITAELQCEAVDDLVECSFTDEAGYDHVAVMSGGDAIETVHDPPYAFTIDPDEHDQVVIELRDEDGTMLKRYVQDVRTT